MMKAHGRSRRELGDLATGCPPGWDCVVEVSRAPGRAGRVESVRFLVAAVDPAAYVGQPLTELLESIGASEAWRLAHAVIEGWLPDGTEVLLSHKDRSFRIVTARAAGDRVTVVVRCVDSILLPELVDAKAASVAEASGLSDRERQVLQLLLRGRGVEDIATILEIAPRTVKFHQANVLRKLGADSRLDLLRVVI